LENINWINKKLSESYGKDDLGRPNFRVTWTEGQLEKRKCRPRIYIGDRFISQSSQTEVYEMPKYPTIKNRYVLERLIHHCNEELVENPSYEPIHVFQDKNGNPLPPVWDMVDYGCHYIMTGQKKSKQSYEEEEAKRMQEEKDQLRAELHDDRPYLPTMIEMGEAVSLPKTDMWIKEDTNGIGSSSRSNDCKSSSVSDQGGQTNS
jgi:hypothetical protein